MGQVTASWGATESSVGPIRLAYPEFPTDDVVVDDPPVIPMVPGGFAAFIPLLAIAVTAGAGAFMWSGGGAGRYPMTIALPVMMLVSAVGMWANSGGRRAITELDEVRRRYLDYLDGLSEQLHNAAELQHRSLIWVHPEAASLWTLAGSQRMWERRLGSVDFLEVRIGTGESPLCRRIISHPRAMVDEYDPVAARYLEQFRQNYASIADAPIGISLQGIPAVLFHGDRDACRGVVRALICQLAMFHKPGELAIAAIVGPTTRPEWDWLKWLPHNTIGLFPDDTHDALVYPSFDAAWDGLARNASRADRSHTVVVVDDEDSCEWLESGLPKSCPPGVTVLLLRASAEGVCAEIAFDCRESRIVSLQRNGSDDLHVGADTLSVTEAKICARRLSRYRATPPIDQVKAWCEGLGAVSVHDIGGGQLWSEPDPMAGFAIPIGVTDSGQLVTLDIKEAAAGGSGPHGLCVGATGSGKSELLRTVVLGLAAKHSPTELNLILIDFKGGATFLGLERLRHTSAIITNLTGERYLIHRMKDALTGEMHRRQELFRRACAANLDDYQRLRRDTTLPTVARLLIVVDEFAELLQHYPDFIDIFTAICRVGRSLGMHLLLASQRLDEGRLRGLESHLSYRVCLKTLAGSESRAVIGVADASELPATPGAAFLRTSDGDLTRFQAICVNVEANEAASFARGAAVEVPSVEHFHWSSAEATIRDRQVSLRRSLFQDVVEQLADRGDPAHVVWLPQLTASPTLSEIGGNSKPDLCAAIGVVDLPFQQRRTPLVVDVSGSGGNVAIVGAPQTGKSTAIRTLIGALVRGHDSHRIQFYCIDFGGGSLFSLRSVAHVGAVAGAHDHELVRRVINEIGELLRWRLAHFAQRQIGSMAAYRLVNTAHKDAKDPYGDVFLIIDGWSAFRDEFGELEAAIVAIAAQGLSVGIHVIVTGNRWAEMRAGFKDLLGSRIELRLGDPIDSEMDRRSAELVPIGVPGRGITCEGNQFALAEPGEFCPEASQWTAPAVRLLPRSVDLKDIASDRATLQGRILLGVNERGLEPVALDFVRQQHLLVVGDEECGKTATLRTICRGITENVSGGAALVNVVDYRRSLLCAFGDDDLSGYAFSAGRLAELMPCWLGQLEARLPSGATSLEQLRSGPWWTGPEVFIVVDDFDLVSAAHGDPLNQLLRVMPYARDIGLHLIIARRSAGVGRAMYDPLLAQLQEDSCMALLMSGSPDEGPVLGKWRPKPQPSGRGLLVTRDDEQLVQVGWCEP